MVEEFIDTNKNKVDFIAWGIYSVLYAILILGGFISLTKGEGLTEFKEFLPFIIFSFGIIAFWMFHTAVVFGKHLTKIKLFQNLVVFAYNPEYSPLSRIPFIKKIFNRPILIILISILILSFSGFFVSIISPQSTLFLFPFEVGEVAQQTTPAGKIFFSLYASPSENGFLFIFLSAIMSVIMIIAHRLKLNKFFTYLASIVPVSFLGAFYWLVVHNLVTGASQLKSLTHWVFGFINSFITLTTGITIITEVYHLINNLFFQMKPLFSSEIVIVVFGFILFLSIILLVIYGFVSLKKKKEIEVL